MDAEEIQMVSSPQHWQQQALELTKVSQAQKDPPLLWAVEVSKCLAGADVEIPSVELGQLLVSHLCWSNNEPMVWKYVEQAIATRLLSSLHILSLLTSRVIPYRQPQPEAYRLYLELLNKYAFSTALENMPSCREMTIKAVDEALQISQAFGMPVTELGQTVVLFVFTVVCNLLNATAEDWGMQMIWSEKQQILTMNTGQNDMCLDIEDDLNDKRHLHRENLRRTNSMVAIELIGKLMEHRKTASLLCLARRNMPEQWSYLFQNLQIFETHSTSSDSKIVSELLPQLIGSIRRGLSQEYQPSQHQAIKVLIDAGSHTSIFEHNYGVGRAAAWLHFDLIMEDAMEGKYLSAPSFPEMLAELIKSLHAVNGASWQETFLGVWIAALRLVQRERDPLEGPVPHLDARLCMLLSITPVTIANLIDVEDRNFQSDRNNGTLNEHSEERNGSDMKRAALVSSLQILGQFDGLLAPPQSVVSAANQAAAKASTFVYGFTGGSPSFDVLSSNDNSIKTGGSMWHLIVEACIARRLIDSSAYFWPGYVRELVNPLSHTAPVQKSPWSALIEGATLSVSLINMLIATPASSLAELEKVYQIAISGSEEERLAAASILCGASLVRGWNVQEHAVRFVVKLLSPPPPPDYGGPGSHLVAYAPLLYTVLIGVTSVDAVHILSLYGVLPEMAAALMPICEVFGSILPTVPQQSSSGEEISVYLVFSCAFLLLLRLWKFYRPPHEHCILGRGAPVGAELTLEYLLLLHNNHLASSLCSTLDKTTKENKQYLVERSSIFGSSLSQMIISAKGQTLDAPSSFAQPVVVDSFPNFKAWYCQHKACIASTLSGLVQGNPVHQIADRLLNMMYRKMNKGGTLSTTTGASAGSTPSSSSGSIGEDAPLRPLLPAWEVLGAVPFVVEAVLTACAHGRLSPRDLTTGWLQSLISAT
ncbi:mediator of RNA polymerase II transcription subunit 33A [Cryptomeria japonica]|uniref:mediator of RNA polymerase II transcription subunit 33A n=1 Tax=Cryptomeria japonica TaxID=3369 RepID=UPI0025ACEF42|nr:mediator of RNA polymerase II transcription subunit 33A [Cryptomeria japonica]